MPLPSIRNSRLHGSHRFRLSRSTRIGATTGCAAQRVESRSGWQGSVCVRLLELWWNAGGNTSSDTINNDCAQDPPWGAIIWCGDMRLAASADACCRRKVSAPRCPRGSTYPAHRKQRSKG
eukprot:362675-Chlamydomonas_euryale.AAC.4